jgi:phosphoglycolate phosphatase
MTKRYDLIVFDWDGTVMDSTAIIAGSIQAACRDLKLTVPDDETARHVIGLGLLQALRYAVPDAPEEMYEPLVARYRHHFLSQNDTIPLFDQALDHALESTQMGEYFHATRTADRTFSKPHPAMLIELMEELDVSPQRTLMIGDTTHDLQMAINAGVDAIGVTHGAHPEDQLRELKPVALLNDFIELRAWFKANA